MKLYETFITNLQESSDQLILFTAALSPIGQKCSKKNRKKEGRKKGKRKKKKEKKSKTNKARNRNEDGGKEKERKEG